MERNNYWGVRPPHLRILHDEFGNLLQKALAQIVPLNEALCDLREMMEREHIQTVSSHTIYAALTMYGFSPLLYSSFSFLSSSSMVKV